MTTIQVERVAVKAKTFASGDSAWPVFSNNEWFDLFQERKPEKGEVYLCDVKVTTKDTPAGQRTYRNAYPKPSPVQVEKAKEVLKPVITATKLYPPEEDPPPKPTSTFYLNPTRTTPYTHPLNDYEKLINRGFELAGINGVTDDAARVSLVAILCIAYGEGKLSIEGMNDALYALDEALDKIDDKAIQQEVDDGWGNRDWTDGPPPESTISPERVRENQEREMEAAKARMDKFVTTSTKHEHEHDYKTELGAAIKTYCFNNKLDFKTNKFEVLWKCAETRNLESLSQAEAKIAIEQLKVMP